jgi:serine/threonine protein kinase
MVLFQPYSKLMTSTPFLPEIEQIEPQSALNQPVPDLLASLDDGAFRPLIAGRYEVVNTQTGGMALVHLCRDQRTNDLVALKTFKPDFLPNRAARDLFLREGTMWVQLGHHPHIVRAYRVERIGDGRELYLVLEWVVQPPDRKKPSLRSWLYPGKPLPVDTAVLFALHIARGMRYATQKIPGLVHRDLKPENVLIGFDGNARVTDFGLASTLSGIGARSLAIQSESSNNFTRTQLTQGVVGTPLYMAPEQWLGQTIDARTDIYALGCILYEMVTGYFAARGNSRAALKAAHVSGKITPPPVSIPREVVFLLRRFMMTRRQRRLRSWAAVEASLEDVYYQLTGTVPPAEKQATAVTRDQRLAMGHSYNTMGRSYLDIGKLPVAITYFEQAVWLGRQEQSLELEASALGHLGLAYFATGYVGRAIDFYQEQLAIARQTGSQAEEAAALGNLGTGYRYIGNLEQAIAFHKQELSLAQTLQNRYMEAAALDHLGDAYRRQGSRERAVGLYQQSLALARQIEDEVRVCSILRSMGRIYQASGEANEALALFDQSLTIAQKMGDRIGEGESLSDIANLHQQLGYELEALDYHNKALHIAEESSDWRGLVRTLLQLGSLYLERAKLTEALAYYQRALGAAREINDQGHEQEALAGLAQAHFELDDYMNSARLQRRALQLAQERGDVKAEKEALLALGRCYERWGDLGRTARYYEQYLAMARQQEDVAGQMRIAERLGDVYVRSKQHRLARPLYEQYLMRLRRVGRPADLIRVMGKLGDVVSTLSDAKEAAEIYKLGLEIAREIKSSLHEADLLSRLALALYDQGRKWRAGRQAEKALNLIQPGGETAVSAYVFYRVARLYMKQGKWHKAGPLARQSLDLFAKLDNQEMAAALQIMVSKIEQEQNNSGGFLF